MFMSTWKDINRSIILASQSPRRRDLLEIFGMPFEVQVTPVKDEARYFTQFPLKQALNNLSIAKASELSSLHPDSLVIGADTVVVCGERILGKPQNREDAFKTLTYLSGKNHEVMTGVSMQCKSTDYLQCSIATTRVVFRTLQEWEIERYLDYGTYTDKAGSYAIQDQGALFVDYIEGCYNNVVGFPTSLVQTMLNRFFFFFLYSYE